MQNRIRTAISAVLAVLLVTAAMPVTAIAASDDESAQEQEVLLTTQAVSPAKMTEAVSKFTDSLLKLTSTLDVDKIGEFGAFLTRFGGVTSAAAGVIGLLQMAGIIEDPTMAQLKQILSDIHGVQDQLKIMDQKLDDIHEELVSMQVSQEEKNRNNNATDMLKYWNDFNRDYCEPLDNMIEQYQGLINGGIKNWWESDSRDGIRVIYTKPDADDAEPSREAALTYTNKNYAAGFPANADNGETVDTDYSFGVPANCLPDTSAIAFDIDNYRSIFIEEMAERFIGAADSRNLDAGEYFYQTWESLPISQKQYWAELYAADILNTQIYHIACDVMSNNDAWVIDVTNAYRNYCDNILKKDSGVNAFLNAMYLTHGFEGEIKQDIEDFLDAMIVKTGYYGQFALTCACQDNMRPIGSKQQVQEKYADAINGLSDKKQYALTGFDNFCYVTGTRVEYGTVTASATMKVVCNWNGDENVSDVYESYQADGWRFVAPRCMDDVYSQVLYHQFSTLNQGCSSFASYLNKYGTGMPQDYAGSILTRFGGISQFPLNEGIWMMKKNNIMGGYFSKGITYRINQGNHSDSKDQYFLVHDRIAYDALDMSTGALRVNQQEGRAFFGASKWNWLVDEAHVFSTLGVTETMERSPDHDYYFRHAIDFKILKLVPVKDANGGEAPEDPFYAFDAPVLSEAASDIGPVEYGSGPSVTDIVFGASSFAYTGEAIEPSVTVVAGEEAVPESGYEVSYIDNEGIGYGTVVVEGKGEYSGVVSEQFAINPPGTSISSIGKTGATATVQWEMQSTEMPDFRITGYQVRYSTSASMENAEAIEVEGYDKTSATIEGLENGETYYFQIRTYVTGEKGTICSEWSDAKSAASKADISYRNTQGDGSTWRKGGTTTLDFAFKRSQDDETTYSHFVGIEIDGSEVPSSNYDTERGSVVIKLEPAYLETLAAGGHTLYAMFDDADGATADFEVLENASGGSGGSAKPAIPVTGDSVDISPLLFLLLASAVVAALSWCRRRSDARMPQARHVRR